MAATAGLIVGTATMVHAQQASRHEFSVPGGRVSGPGTAGAAAGHEQQKESKPGMRGASGFAPGRAGTTGAGDRDDRIGDDRDEMPDNRQGRLHDRDDRPTTGDLDDRR
jgi:hypothetical protein